MDKKVDKLGRVRPRTYTTSDLKPKKKRVSVQQQQQHSPEDNELVNDGIFRETKNTIINLLDNENFTEVMDEDNEDLSCFDFVDLDIDDTGLDEGEEDVNRVVLTEDSSQQSIYHGHHLTVHASMVMILLYSICHNISGVQLSDLLTIISAHCLYPHPGIKSLHSFKNYFASMNSPVKKHFFCTTCHTIVSDIDSITCQNCNADFIASKAKKYFIEVPVETQIQSMFNKHGICELLQHRFNRTKKHEDRIEDIYDGALYKELAKPGGPLSEMFPYNISFTWNTDGIPVFKSSKFSLWPIYLTVNELPYKLRLKRENMLLAGLWFGEEKPIFNMFAKPLMSSLKTLEEEGIFVNDILIKAFLICGTADLPAKSIVMNCNQFNGAFSCMRCLNPGETFKTNKGGSVRVFPHDVSNVSFESRTDEHCLNSAILATEKKTAVNGIKGPSFLMAFKHYSFVSSSAIDYMHGVLLGITKLLITLWISPSFSKEKFSVSGAVDLIDERLTFIKPPSFITRIPRTLSNHFKYWKASELRSWLFYYSLPILHDILSKDYLLHYACFVEAVVLLCSDSISDEDIARSERLFSYFVYMCPHLYSDRYITLNMHSLLHLPQCVKDLGPLWVYSCFPYEDANGSLLKLFHGTQNVEMQILAGINIIQNQSTLTDQISDSKVLNFILKLKATNNYRKLSHVNDSGTSSGSHLLGKGTHKDLSDETYVKVVKEYNCKPTKILQFQRIKLRGCILHSESYARVHARNSYTVKYFCSKNSKLQFGSIVNFLYVKKCDCLQDVCNCDNCIVAVMKLFECLGSIMEENFLNIKVPSISVCKLSSQTDVIDVRKIIEVQVNVSFKEESNLYFLCDVPNVKECD